MNSVHGQMRMNIEGDRLSSLPDDLIHKILSFVDIKDAIGTGVLSSRWRFIWTSMQYLNFSCDDFSTLPKFSKFATRVLSHRDKLAEVYSMRLSFRGSGSVTQQFVKRILNYASSHNIKHLSLSTHRYGYSSDVVLTSTWELPSLTTLDLNCVAIREDNADKSIGILSKCANLKNLTLKWFKTTGSDGFCIFHHRLSNLTLEDISRTVKVVNVDAPQLKNLTVRSCHAKLVISAPNLASLLYKDFYPLPLSHALPLSFPRLLNLTLENISKSVKVVNVDAPQLKNLTVRSCHARLVISAPNLASLLYKDFHPLPLSHPRLLNLTLENISKSVKVVNVRAPQLKNLTIRYCDAELVISAPNLASLLYIGSRPLSLSTNGFHTLEKADIRFFSPQRSDAHQIVCLLQLLHNAKFLTLNQEIVKLLSSSEVPLLHQPSPFVNLKNLKIYPEKVCSSEVTMSPALYSYLLDSFPKCNFTAVVHEEVRAQNIMAQLRSMLKEWKDNTKTNGADIERGKAYVESHTPKKPNTGGNMAQMVGCWKNLSEQIKNACTIIIKVQDVEELLTKFPASKRAEIQPCFSSLCAEADIVITQIKDFMKIHCDENQSLSSVFFPELATTLESSS